MAVIRYILGRSAYDNPSRWNPAELRGPLLSDPLHRYRAHPVPVENEQVMHVYEMHHVMAHLPFEIFTASGELPVADYKEEVTIHRDS